MREYTKLGRQAGKSIPVLIFPDGSRIEVTPGFSVNDPAVACRTLEAWLLAWQAEESCSPATDDAPAEDAYVCARCDGSGHDPTSNRPDDYGPHLPCLACGGSGAVAEEQIDDETKEHRRMD